MKIEPVNPTIAPVPCGGPLNAGTLFCGESFTLGVNTYKRLCPLCEPLGRQMINHATSMGEYGFDEDWAYLLTWNLTLAALCTAAADNAVYDYCTPVLTMRALKPEDEALFKRRLAALDTGRSLSRAVLFDNDITNAEGR